MTDFMLTTFSPGVGLRDIQVNNAPGIKEAIQLAEKQTGARVSHGRGGIGNRFDPALIIDAATGVVERRHDHKSALSGQVASGRGETAVRVVVPKGS